MGKIGEIEWDGITGKKYRYHIYPIAESHNAVPANYLFAKKNADGQYSPIYVGETGDISERFDSHHKMPCIKQRGATHLCTHKSSEDATVRRLEEQDIKKKLHPPCND